MHVMFTITALVCSMLCALVNGDCWTRGTMTLNDDYYRGGLRAAPDEAGCAAEAKQARIKAIQDTVNIDAITTAEARSDMEQIAASGGAQGGGGSYGTSSSNSGSTSIEYAGVRWIAVVDGCTARNVQVADGNDRGWGQGRAANGYCSAQVSCKVRFFTPQINC